MIRDEIINGIRRDAEGVNESGFPLDAFPQKAQEIILDMIHSENYVVDYAATSMLSAVASALGNAIYIRIKSNWISNPALFVIMVGRPGLGKTPPLRALYEPLQRMDTKLMTKYVEELKKTDALKAAMKPGEADTNIIPPVLKQTLVSDFTIEALIRTHDDNRRGVTVIVDEIMGMFNTVNRYSQSNLIDIYLSSFSGEPIRYMRKSSNLHCVITHPFINLIGTTQTLRIPELYAKGLDKNGFLDRVLFAYPKRQQVSMWIYDESAQKQGTVQYAETWSRILEKVSSLECNLSANGEGQLKVIDFEASARRRLYEWRNNIMSNLNQMPFECGDESREAKRAHIVARLALNLQALRWACGESHLQFIDLASVEGAIRLSDYFEDCFSRMKQAIDITGGVDATAAIDRDDRLLSMLDDQFSTKDAVDVGTQFSIKERAVKERLNKLVANGKIERIKNGVYRKVQPCTNCTNDINDTNETPDSHE